MVNALRTLLYHRAGPYVPPGDLPGDAYVPAYQPPVLPAALVTLRGVLFGLQPDDAMLRYRLRQLLAIVHASPLAAYAVDLDPRITYRLDDAPWADPAVFLPRATRYAQGLPPIGSLPVFDAMTFNSGLVLDPTIAADSLAFSGAPSAPDGPGRMSYSYTVTINADASVTVTAAQPPGFNLTQGFTPTIDKVPLPGSGYSVRLGAANPGSAWLVQVTNRPQTGPGALVASAASAGEPTLLALFGAAPVEPYKTFAGAWNDQRETPLRLAALVLALAYRTAALLPGGTA
jgi:hypothetical protein